MTQLRRPQPIAPAPIRSWLHEPDDEDVRALLVDLHQQPGIYTATAIYTYYKQICTTNGRRSLAANMFGRKLRSWGYQPTRNEERTARCWIIPPNVEPPKPQPFIIGTR